MSVEDPRARPCALSRRQAMIGAAALPAAAAFAAGPARAEAPLEGPATAPWQRFRLGGFEVTPLLAGTATIDAPQEIFGLDASPEDFAAVSEAAFIPADRARSFFTPTLVNTGEALVLFDTGMDPAGITAALAAAGIEPGQVDIVVLTHMHGDHIGGLADGSLAEGGTETFPNARYVAGAIEHNHWSTAGNAGFDGKVAPLAERMSFLDDGDSVAPGITAILAAGHTPGHMIYRIESEGAALILTADTANHYVWSLGRPDWEVHYDLDKAAAAATRREVFGMIADERIPFIGYHMPFPALGFVETTSEGFRFVPASYQLSL